MILTKPVSQAETKRQLKVLADDLIDASLANIGSLRRQMIAQMDRDGWRKDYGGDDEITPRAIALAMIARRERELESEIPVEETPDEPRQKEQQMAHIDLIYKSNSSYLKAEDIGTDMPTFTMTSADVKTFDDGSAKVVVEFSETDKILPLNKTNATAIADLYGLDTDAWVNRQIMLFTMPVEFNGKMVQAIRVRGPATQRQNYGAAKSGMHSPGATARHDPAKFDEMNPPPPDGYR
jgi:hypothetical protein